MWMSSPPCEERACSSKADAMRKMFGRVGKPPPTAERADTPAITCPPDRDELGRHSWTLVSFCPPTCTCALSPRCCLETRREPSDGCASILGVAAPYHGCALSRHADGGAVECCHRLCACNRHAVPLRPMRRGLSQWRFGKPTSVRPPSCRLLVASMMALCDHDTCIALDSRCCVPLRAGSRAELSLWICEAHNRVNLALGKPIFSCDLAELDARWRDGGPACDETSLLASSKS